jgi:hypothetical protein
MAESKFPQRVLMALSALLVLGGIAVYVGWGIAYGSWNFFKPEFIPVYAITVVMILFGGLGLLLLRAKK